MPLEELTFLVGIRLLGRWQAGDPQAIARLTTIFDATIKGESEYTQAIKKVANTITDNAYESREPPWQGALDVTC
jgi:hypothetical protein